MWKNIDVNYKQPTVYKKKMLTFSYQKVFDALTWEMIFNWSMQDTGGKWQLICDIAPEKHTFYS
jgi:hypothetical protein